MHWNRLSTILQWNRNNMCGVYQVTFLIANYLSLVPFYRAAKLILFVNRYFILSIDTLTSSRAGLHSFLRFIKGRYKSISKG